MRSNPRQITVIVHCVLFTLTLATPTAQLAGSKQSKLGRVVPSRQKAEPARPRGRALIVGIEKYQQPWVTPTPGGVADAWSMSNLVQQMGWFESGEIKVLTDEKATASSISQNFKSWLIDGSKPGDQILFYYSGHGTQVPDVDMDERVLDPGDGHDEAIAPYDVGIDSYGKHRIITDDQFNHWLDLLAGRSVVMIFDSCHSGTVSRTLNNTSTRIDQLGPRFVGLEPLTRSSGTRSILDQGASQAVAEDGPATRNLRLVIDEKRLKPNSLVTLISAAGSYQLAYPMKTPDKIVRGALTHFLEAALTQSPNQPVFELREFIKREIKRAQIEKRLNGSQIPHIEMNSPSMIVNKPLFQARISDGNESAEPVESMAILGNAPINPGSDNRVTARIGRVSNGNFVAGPTSFCIGESIGYRITTRTPGYLFMVVFSQEDKASLIYPLKHETTGKYIDGQQDLLNDFEVTEPEGKDLVLFFVTKTRIDLTRFRAKKVFTWAEMKAELGKMRIEVGLRTRGIGTKPDQNQLAATDWQVTSVESEAKDCSGGKH
jgi:hypothetical protein